MKLFLILSNQYRSPELDSNLGPSRIAVFEDSKATALTHSATTAGLFPLYKDGTILQIQLCVLSKIDCLSGTIDIYKVSERLNNPQLNLWPTIKRLNCLTCGRSAKGRYSGMFSRITLSVSSMPM